MEQFLLFGMVLASAWLWASCAHQVRSLKAELHRIETTRQTVVAPPQLAAKVDELHGAVDAHVAATRREFGRMWKRIGLDTRASSGAAAADEGVTDPQLSAMLALQSAPAPK